VPSEQTQTTLKQCNNNNNNSKASSNVQQQQQQQQSIVQHTQRLWIVQPANNQTNYATTHTKQQHKL
jgi:hypothetical protein